MNEPRRTIEVPSGDGTKAGFLRDFAAAAGLEGLHATNWDAFADACSDFVAGRDEPVELNHQDFPRLTPDDLRTYRAILADVGEELPGRLSVRFPADAPPRGDGEAGAPVVAVAHYHLNRGGVTRVAANHLLALAAAAPDDPPPAAVLLTGGRAEAWGPHAADLETAGVRVGRPVVAGLDYDDLNPRRLAAAANRTGSPTGSRTALADHGATRDETVLHVHNHALGKNVSLPGAVADSPGGGGGSCCNCTTSRRSSAPRTSCGSATPSVRTRQPLPAGPAGPLRGLNGRDRGVLEALGVPPDRLHFLPNPVADFPTLPDRRDAKRTLADACGVPVDARYFCYPVRGIRRKNLGEAVLTAVLEPDAVVGVTLEPRNPAELAFHDRWRAFCDDHDLPVRFGTGEAGGVSFHQNLAAADAVLTTSVAEGFGMVFLEAWLADRPLVGRDLPHVTADFRAEGLELPGLYDSLTVPVEWVPEFPARFRAGCEKLLGDYRRPWDEAAFEDALAAKTAGGRVDFGDLDETMQEAVIRRLVDDPAARGEVRTDEVDPGRPTDGVVERNAAVVRAAYDLAGSGRRLRAVYDAVLPRRSGRSRRRRTRGRCWTRSSICDRSG